MTEPKFTIDDIKYAEDKAMFERAKGLYESGMISDIREDRQGYYTQVKGTHLYDVGISNKRIDEGYCNCYMGENDMLCKHMLALGIAVLNKSGKIEKAKEEEPIDTKEVRRRISEGMRKLVAYSGPSKVWFSYQRKLSTSAGIISNAIQSLPASDENAKYLWSIVMKINDKLAYSGIDDSDGTVGDCVYDIIAKLAQYTRDAPKLLPTVETFCKDETGFGFEDELREMLKQSNTSA